MRGPRVFLAPCVAWRVSILYPKKRCTSSKRSPPGRDSAGPFCSSTRRSKSRPVCLTNVGHWRPLRGSQVLLASFSLTHARSSGFPRPPEMAGQALCHATNTTTPTRVLLPNGRHTAARQRVKAARQFSGWSPAARFSRSLRFLLTPPMRGPRVFLAPHKWLAKLFVMPPTLPSPCHSTWPNTTPAGLPATRYSHFPRLSLSPLSCEVLGFSSPPCIAWKVSILYPKKKINLVLTESPRQGTSAGPFCCSTRRSKSRPVCLTNVGH